MEPNKLDTVISLLQSAAAIDRSRVFATGPSDVYAESIDNALGNVFEFVGSLLSDLSCEQEAEDEPFEDFGAEPMSKEDAIKQISGFIARCCSILAADANVRPYMSMSVRATTFFCVLCLPSESRDKDDMK
jgi:hypothetical protein